MRSDMGKIAVLRARVAAPYGKPERAGERTQDPEALPSRERMRPYGECKGLNENFAPVVRWLYGQVGRPWSKVYSELRENLRVDTTLGYHLVRQHIPEFVYVDCYAGRDGNVYAPRWGRHAGPLNHTTEDRPYRTLGRGQLYVDPRDGILKRQRHRRPRPERAPTDRLWMGDTYYRRIEGTWFEVATEPRWPKPEEPRVDVVVARGGSDDHGREVVATKLVRTLGKKEVRRVEAALRRRR